MMFSAAADGTRVFYDGNGFVYHERVPTVLALGFRVLLLFSLGALGLGVLWPTIWLPPHCEDNARWPCAPGRARERGASTCSSTRSNQTPIPELATFNARTAALFVLSSGIPICAVASVVATTSALLHRRGELGTRVAAVLVTLAWPSLRSLRVARYDRRYARGYGEHVGVPVRSTAGTTMISLISQRRIHALPAHGLPREWVVVGAASRHRVGMPWAEAHRGAFS